MAAMASAAAAVSSSGPAGPRPPTTMVGPIVIWPWRWSAAGASRGRRRCSAAVASRRRRLVGLRDELGQERHQPGGRVVAAAQRHDELAGVLLVDRIARQAPQAQRLARPQPQRGEASL